MTVHAMPPPPTGAVHLWDPRRIAALRERRGWTQEELAERSGLSVRTIRNLELGVVLNPRRSSVGLLAEALGVEAPSARRLADGFAGTTPWRGPRPPAGEPVGHTAERARLAQVVRTHRLTTLLGPGGIGKSRIALHLAAEVASGFRHGVAVVELGDLAPEPRGRGVEGRTAAVMARVRRQLRGVAGATDDDPELNVLLVLDNAEHVPDGVLAVARELLDTHPGMHILITSRRRLTERLGGNVELAPLPAGPAVELMLRHAGPGLRAADDLQRDLPLVAELCRRLGGLPRHLEFAAERMRTIPVRQLLAYGPALWTLWSHDHALLPHQRSVAASIRWDADLLGAEHAHLLTRLAALGSATFTLEDLDDLGSRALSLFSDLHEAALVVPDAGGPYRYRLAPFVAEVMTDPRDSAIAS